MLFLFELAVYAGIAAVISNFPYRREEPWSENDYIRSQNRIEKEVRSHIASKIRKMLKKGLSIEDILDPSECNMHRYIDRLCDNTDNIRIENISCRRWSIIPSLAREEQSKLWRKQGEQRKIAQLAIKECVCYAPAGVYLMSSSDMEKVFLHFITKLEISFWEQSDDNVVLKKEIKKAIRRWEEDLPNHTDRINAVIKNAERHYIGENIILRITENPLVWRAIYKETRGGFQEFKPYSI